MIVNRQNPSSFLNREIIFRYGKCGPWGYCFRVGEGGNLEQGVLLRGGVGDF